MNSISMTKRQVGEVLEFIKNMYPHFVVDQSKLDAWSYMLKNQDPDKVMKKAETYSMSNKFPPTIADLYEKRMESRRNDFLDKIEKWEREASGKPRS